MNLVFDKNSSLGGGGRGDLRGCGRGDCPYTLLLEINTPPPVCKTLCPGCSNSDWTILRIHHYHLSCVTVTAILKSNDQKRVRQYNLFKHTNWV